MATPNEIIEGILAKTLGTSVNKKTGKEKNKPVAEFELVYDSPSETLEPVYFWIVDMMNNLFGNKVEKLVDNFSSSPGGGHFSELSQKKNILQKNVTEAMGTVNTVIKSIVNIVYDLKDFEIRLAHYDDEKSKDKNKAEAGLLALKQIWMDNVDIKRGVGSINALASGNLQFVTLRDAFMIANSVEDVKNMDLNDRVKRILEPRIDEFLKWKDLSEIELRKRFNIEKNYLKSQVSMLQLYSRWVKPYLKAASQLEMKEPGRNPAVVTAFNTLWLELTIFGKSQIDFKDALISKQMPNGIKKPKRDYFSCVLVNFSFRGIPQKVGQHYTFGGRANVKFQAYALNKEELDLLEQELKKSDIEDMLKLIEGSTTESLDEMKKDIDYFLNKKDVDKKEEEERKSKDTNPFSALFNFKTVYKKEEKEEEIKEIKIEDVKKDSYVEGIMRALAADSASEACFNVYDIYKKAHNMASHDSPFEE